MIVRLIVRVRARARARVIVRVRAFPNHFVQLGDKHSKLTLTRTNPNPNPSLTPVAAPTPDPDPNPDDRWATATSYRTWVTGSASWLRSVAASKW